MDTPDDKPAVSDGPNAAGTGKTRRIDLRLRTLNGTLWRLSWPAVVENLLFSMVFFSDTLITGWLRDERMLAATALAGLLMFLMNAPFIAYSAAANSIVSRSWGEHDFLTARRCAGITVGLSILLAVLLYFAAWPFADAVVRLFGADDQVAPISGRYLRILLLSGFCGYPMMISNAVIRGTGNTRTPMLIAVLMNGTNVLFSVIFAFGWLGFPPMGVYGVAWGTVVARGVGFACSAGYMLHSRGVGVSPAFLVRGDRTMLARLWRLAWPTLAERFGNSVVYLIFMRQVAGLGTTVLAAHQIALQVESLAFMPGWAMGVATTTIVGQAIGARLEHIAESAVRRMMVIAALLMAFLGVIFVVFGPDIVRLFGATDAVVAQAAVAIRISAVELLFMAWTFIIMGALRGAGDARSPLFVTIASTLIFRLGGTLLLAYAFNLGLAGVWLATAADWAVRTIGLGIFFTRGAWKQLHELEKQRFGL
jgi:putative MATE family efflux protein